MVNSNKDLYHYLNSRTTELDLSSDNNIISTILQFEEKNNKKQIKGLNNNEFNNILLTYKYG